MMKLMSLTQAKKTNRVQHLGHNLGDLNYHMAQCDFEPCHANPNAKWHHFFESFGHNLPE